jgi:predicted NAD-dependent protein-ADP-ribosyltransferase YbiA (DUF1768 family)
MDIGSNNSGPAGKLSNFTPRPFVFRGVECNSMEGLLQSFKFKDPEMQKHCCTLVGFKAKKFGSKKNWQTTQTLWWQGEPIKRDSDEYQELLDEAYEALYTNEKAKKTLLATNDANLTHSIGRSKMNETVLTKQEFCSRLMKIRAKLKADKFVEF